MQGEGSAAAVAEQLVAEEAQEAAKAAAKKAKKQKAKARKQQARSDATSASTPSASAEPRLQTEQHEEPMATLHQLAHALPLESRGEGSIPNPDIAGFQSEQRHTAEHASAMHSLLVQTVVDEEEVSNPGAAAGGLPAGNQVDSSRDADASFLHQLFCCPITKVTPLTPVMTSVCLCTCTMCHLPCCIR